MWAGVVSKAIDHLKGITVLLLVVAFTAFLLARFAPPDVWHFFSKSPTMQVNAGQGQSGGQSVGENSGTLAQHIDNHNQQQNDHSQNVHQNNGIMKQTNKD